MGKWRKEEIYKTLIEWGTTRNKMEAIKQKYDKAIIV
jgi:hypothetical protein